ncbi:MAG: multiple sugar transport system substrate-binding protein [Thermomicrobiales bacterium]|jgi:multiple sugar transport system substrate-binding protein|nr:multiple sugar transport system substrate-binding protein [Thermomicrobiales bacterium]
MRDDFLRRSLNRRSMLKATGGATLGAALTRGDVLRIEAAAQEATPTRNIAGTELKILQWSHFVPSYDEWFDAFAKAWGEANQVTVTVDHINTADVPATLAAEIGAGEGHDLVEHISSLAQYEKSMLDMRDVVEEAAKRHGEQLAMCMRNSFNPTTNAYYGYCHGYAPDPGDYRKSLWDAVGLPNGPTTWQELLDGGMKIKTDQGVQMGIGMSNEIDSRMAAQTLIWAHGGAIQDANENVTINSPETIAAVEYMANLFKNAMTDEVFGWNAASNNQLLIAGQASYILNSISAYRTAQEAQPDVAKDVFFSRPLVGPAGQEAALAHGHAVFIYQIPQFSKNQDTAKEFLLYLSANYEQATDKSKFYNFPAFANLSPNLTAEGGWLDNDPYGSDPANKLAVLKDANSWTTNLGHPGPANAALGEIFALPLIPDMMARAARGEQTAQESVAQAETEIKEIFERWKGEGLVGGGQS